MRIFGKSRRGFIKQKKIRNYALYSIGEITLVVVGILIALSIDNWNDERKDLLKEKQILSQLKAEYESNLAQLNEKIALRERITTGCYRIVKQRDDYATTSRDSLMGWLSLLMIDPTFDPIQNDLVVSGNLRLIRNEELKRLLTNWSADVIALQELERRWVKLADDMIVPFFIESEIARDAADVFANDFYNSSSTFFLDKDRKKLKTNRSLGKSKRAQSVAVIYSNTKLEGVLAIAYTLNLSANIQSDALKKRINQILMLIEKERLSQ